MLKTEVPFAVPYLQKNLRSMALAFALLEESGEWNCFMSGFNNRIISPGCMFFK